jgi:hypothetical protein
LLSIRENISQKKTIERELIAKKQELNETTQMVL